MCLTQANPPSRAEVEKKKASLNLMVLDWTLLLQKVMYSGILASFLYAISITVGYFFSLSLQIIKCDADCVFAFKMEAPGLGC